MMEVWVRMHLGSCSAEMFDQKPLRVQEMRCSLFVLFVFNYCQLSVMIFLSLRLWYKCDSAYQDVTLAKHCKHNFQ